MSKIPGEFVPLDVRYRRDRAIRRAGAEAELLYVRALTLAKREETCGAIEDYDIHELTEGLRDPDAAVAALVEHQLWVETGTGSWVIRSWEKWNPITDPSASGTLGNHIRWHQSRGVVAPDCPHCGSDIAPESPPSRPDDDPIIAPDIAPESGMPSQNREEKSREEKSREERGDTASPKPKSKRGTRLPDGWLPDDDVRAKMRAEFPTLDFAAEHSKFADHWHAQPGTKGVKADWNATWRNWIRRAAEYQPVIRSAPTSKQDRNLAIIAAAEARWSRQDELGHDQRELA